MSKQVRLAEPKLVPLNEAEQAEAVRLLAVLLRASIAARRTDWDCDAPTPSGAGCGTGRASDLPQPRHLVQEGVESAAGLPMAPGANGKRSSREPAGEQP